MFYKYKRIIVAVGVVILSAIAFVFIYFVNHSSLLGNVNSTSENNSINNISNNDTTNNKVNTPVALKNNEATKKNESINNGLVANETDNKNTNINNDDNLNNAKIENINTQVGGSIPVVVTNPTPNYNTKNIVKDNNVNINYNTDLAIKNKKDEIVFRIENAKIISKTQISFDILIIKNVGMGGLNVLATDNFGNSLSVNPTVKSNGNIINYSVNLVNPKTKCIEILVQNEFNTNEAQSIQVAI